MRRSRVTQRSKLLQGAYRYMHHFPHGLIRKSSNSSNSIVSNYRANPAGSGLEAIDAPKALIQVIQTRQKPVLRHVLSKDRVLVQRLGTVQKVLDFNDTWHLRIF